MRVVQATQVVLASRRCWPRGGAGHAEVLGPQVVAGAAMRRWLLASRRWIVPKRAFFKDFTQGIGNICSFETRYRPERG